MSISDMRASPFNDAASREQYEQYEQYDVLKVQCTSNLIRRRSVN